METKPRILVVSDDCRLDTGFGRVARQILDYLHTTGKYELAQHGWFFNRLRSGRTSYRIYPTKLSPNGYIDASDSYGWETIDPVLQNFRPDIVLSIGDPWMVYGLAYVRHRHHFRWIAYTPVDSELRPKILFQSREMDLSFVFDRMDVCTAYGNFGEGVIRRVFGKRVKDLRQIPHGVDGKIYRPLDPKQVAIYKHNELDLPVGSVLMGMFSRNQPRKNVPDAIRTLAMLLKNRTFCQDCGGIWEGTHKTCPANRYAGTPIVRPCNPKALHYGKPRENLYLYLHMSPDDVGWHLAELASMFGVAHTRHLRQLGSSKVGVGVSENELAMLYNACDFGLLPTHREGWGLTLAETMACGKPVVVPDYSGHTDFVVGKRVALDPTRPFSWDTQSNLADAWTHFAMLVLAADQLTVEDPDEFRRSWGIPEDQSVEVGATLRDRLGREAWQVARGLDWSAGILKQWEDLIDEQLQVLHARPDWAYLVPV